ncbi:MAG: T9SS type A sorting domain-containing protein [Flavobacteriales bacterium]|nr:T9SS type A sorting domain-containing protein [Flavobacteriales bacterium]
MKITDSTGRMIGQPRPVMSGSGAVDVDVSGLAPGAYIVSLRSGNTEVSKRFLRLP